MIYTIADIRERIKPVVDRYDIEELRLFGSYATGKATESSDVDMVVTYGNDCRGLTCIRFMDELEHALGKPVDVVNREYLPRFLKDVPLEGLPLVYVKKGGQR